MEKTPFRHNQCNITLTGWGDIFRSQTRFFSAARGSRNCPFLHDTWREPNLWGHFTYSQTTSSAHLRPLAADVAPNFIKPASEKSGFRTRTSQKQVAPLVIRVEDAG
jgi:hypothetical protein